MAKIAILGFGVVGSGIAELVAKNPEKLARSAGGEKIELGYILDVRDFPGSPFEKYIIHDFEVIENDPEISIVCECIGGAGIAFEFVRRALEKGKSVCTSNKQLVAEKGLELLAAAKKTGAGFYFEAAVGGVVPVIRSVQTYFASNDIKDIFGIMNATTNYILTEMKLNGRTYEEALHDAQVKGYAEADPSADVDGIDTCRKVCILADIAFGMNVRPELVNTTGIRSITAEDTLFAEKLGCSIKLIGRTLRVGDKITAFAAPHLVPADFQASSVDGDTNIFTVSADDIKPVSFIGAGAGMLPTAGAVVSDVADAAKKDSRGYLYWEDKGDEMFMSSEEFVSKWFVRAKCSAVSLSSRFKAEALKNGKYAAVVTVPMAKKDIDALTAELPECGYFRVLESAVDY